jgi:hypothetical protein
MGKEIDVLGLATAQNCSDRFSAVWSSAGQPCVVQLRMADTNFGLNIDVTIEDLNQRQSDGPNTETIYINYTGAVCGSNRGSQTVRHCPPVSSQVGKAKKQLRTARRIPAQAWELC